MTLDLEPSKKSPQLRRRVRGAWSRLSSADRAALVTLALAALVPLAFVVVNIVVDDTGLPIGARFALLLANLAFLVVVLQVAFSKFAEAVRDDVQTLQSQLVEAIGNMAAIASLGDAFTKIAHQTDPARSQYQSTLQHFLNGLSRCIDEKRSGALSVMDYYDVLNSTALRLKTECDRAGGPRTGEIWALSFILDDEWDEDSRLETNWFSRLQELDKFGIPTRRLWALDRKRLAALRTDPLSDEGRDLIERVKLYCSRDSPFANTVSIAIPKESISDAHVMLFGKGFFATRLPDQELNLIRGVDFDSLLSSNSLGGEIDFDSARIRDIRAQWERYCRLATPLSDFLLKDASASATSAMKLAWNIA